MIVKTPKEWCEKLETQIIDPDGWRGRWKKSILEPIPLVEFLFRWTKSTALHPDRESHPLHLAMDSHSQDLEQWIEDNAK